MTEARTETDFNVLLSKRELALMDQTLTLWWERIKCESSPTNSPYQHESSMSVSRGVNRDALKNGGLWKRQDAGHQGVQERLWWQISWENKWHWTSAAAKVLIQTKRSVWGKFWNVVTCFSCSQVNIWTRVWATKIPKQLVNPNHEYLCGVGVDAMVFSEESRLVDLE